MKVTVLKKKRMGEEEVVPSSSEGGGGSGGEGTGDVEDGEGKTVVVGVRMDALSKELLTWALVKVAEPGDRVIALHVLPNSSFFSDPDGKSPSVMISLVKSFDSVLAVYEGFCNLKQIDLKLKICRGSSIRKVLVREVGGFGAVKLILGVTKNSIGSFSTSIAKYCAKKLPRECRVAAVNNGKIVFQREAAVPSADQSSPAKEKGNNKEKCSKFQNGSNGELYCLLPTRSSGPHGDNGEDGKLPSSSVSAKQNCSVCSPDSDPAGQDGKQEEEDSSPLALVREAESVPQSKAPPSTPDLTNGGSRWPLIRRTVKDKTKSSVVHWAMRLPTRHSTSAAVHPDRKSTKPEKNGRSRLGIENGTVTSVETEAPCPSDANNSEKLLEITKEFESLHEKYASKCKLFTYKELANATSNFSDDNWIGKGGNSQVFKGCLPDGGELAVKILNQSEDVLKEFLLEIEIITTLQHSKIISLTGFCFENNKLLLVYGFLSRGSLEENLHGEKSKKSLFGWPQRYKVAVGVAEALDYLHSGRGAQPVIHRDVKSSNVLLSDDFEPQLSDFGLATWASSTSAHITCSDVAGTFGYLAPEYFSFGKVNEKIDVYAFGVVLLELLSGRKPIANEYPKGQQSLVMWAKPILQSGKAEQLLDPNLGSEYDNSQLDGMLLAASLCLRRSPKLRPKMALILKLLQGDDETTKWARSQLSASEEIEGFDEEVAYPAMNNIQSHLSLALLDVEDDVLSMSSASHSVDYIMAHSSLEAYLQGRWSRSSSFD